MKQNLSNRQPRSALGLLITQAKGDLVKRPGCSYLYTTYPSTHKLLNRIPEQDREVVREFDQRLAANGIAPITRANHIRVLIDFRTRLGKPFREATRADLEKLLAEFGKTHAPVSLSLFSAKIKRFYKWLLGNDEDYPELVRWIRTTPRNGNRLPRDSLLTNEDIEKLARAADNTRDRAIVLVLAESGIRVGELLSLRVGDVRFDQYGAIITVEGKTGSRAVRLIASAPALATYLEHHRDRDNPSAPLWLTIKRRRIPALDYDGTRRLLKNLAERAGVKKRVHPHGFRHTAATRLARLLTEAEMKQYFGWVGGSQMAGIYVHLASRDVDRSLLRVHGLITEDQDRELKFKAVKCPRCDHANSPGSRTCGKCGLPLTFEAAKKIDEREKVRRALLEKIKEMPEFEKIKDLIDALGEKLLAE